jgi:hypothetical protein
MPPLKIQRDDECDRVVTVVFLDRASDAGGLRCAVSVAPVENLAVERDHRLAHAMGADVLDKRIEFRAFDQREEIGQGVKGEG